jgi:hypothetical protein
MEQSQSTLLSGMAGGSDWSCFTSVCPLTFSFLQECGSTQKDEVI